MLASRGVGQIALQLQLDNEAKWDKIWKEQKKEEEAAAKAAADAMAAAEAKLSEGTPADGRSTVPSQITNKSTRSKNTEAKA
eukprot:CAMPEP_0197661574 /NCGR_PEP_ID=MMETSP1338-20131121/51534_1 /TAXON_ID=43686 ORGANISM="Pelagodinium beii, Strain RCC1491" /NCGR_SAMPLE_ID=MMETSP1338 /ASSEMBLY_ACC=CAM_ASM_000754 /LENGTH=81 /DNA_ID=CAMNT_0043239145 /DNA_START=40 /DNA_END=285 /DNA_ORIENTATION=+